MSIQEKQNQPESLAKLAAQRLLYRYSKRVRNLSMILVVLVGISALAIAITENQIAGYTITVVILASWLLDELVLKERENGFKAEGATIQEDFDCFVLDLPWPVHKGIHRPTPDPRESALYRCQENAKSLGEARKLVPTRCDSP